MRIVENKDKLAVVRVIKVIVTLGMFVVMAKWLKGWKYFIFVVMLAVVIFFWLYENILKMKQNEF